MQPQSARRYNILMHFVCSYVWTGFIVDNVSIFVDSYIQILGKKKIKTCYETNSGETSIETIWSKIPWCSQFRVGWAPTSHAHPVLFPSGSQSRIPLDIDKCQHNSVLCVLSTHWPMPMSIDFYFLFHPPHPVHGFLNRFLFGYWQHPSDVTYFFQAVLAGCSAPSSLAGLCNASTAASPAYCRNLSGDLRLGDASEIRLHIGPGFSYRKAMWLW